MVARKTALQSFFIPIKIAAVKMIMTAKEMVCIKFSQVQIIAETNLDNWYQLGHFKICHFVALTKTNFLWIFTYFFCILSLVNCLHLFIHFFS
jgi:hypothetical protein